MHARVRISPVAFWPPAHSARSRAGRGSLRSVDCAETQAISAHRARQMRSEAPSPCVAVKAHVTTHRPLAPTAASPPAHPPARTARRATLHCVTLLRQALALDFHTCAALVRHGLRRLAPAVARRHAQVSMCVPSSRAWLCAGLRVAVASSHPPLPVCCLVPDAAPRPHPSS